MGGSRRPFYYVCVGWEMGLSKGVVLVQGVVVLMVSDTIYSSSSEPLWVGFEYESGKHIFFKKSDYPTLRAAEVLLQRAEAEFGKKGSICVQDVRLELGSVRYGSPTDCAILRRLLLVTVMGHLGFHMKMTRGRRRIDLFSRTPSTAGFFEQFRAKLEKKVVPRKPKKVKEPKEAADMEFTLPLQLSQD